MLLFSACINPVYFHCWDRTARSSTGVCRLINNGNLVSCVYRQTSGSCHNNEYSILKMSLTNKTMVHACMVLKARQHLERHWLRVFSNLKTLVFPFSFASYLFTYRISITSVLIAPPCKSLYIFGSMFSERFLFTHATQTLHDSQPQNYYYIPQNYQTLEYIHICGFAFICKARDMALS